MKVLIVSTSDMSGGAARAAYRLHQGLQRIGVQSRMLVQNKYGNDPDVDGPRTKAGKACSLIRPALDAYPVKKYKNRSKTSFSPAWLPFSPIASIINASDADLVHLHWINQGMLRPEDMAEIRKPLVWSLHDMWPFTGGCHYDDGCGRYQYGCGQCKALGSATQDDLSRSVLDRKLLAFSRIEKMSIIGLSRWITDCAMESMALKRFPIVTLPNPLDTDAFSPFDRQAARQLLGLPLEKKLVAFGSLDVADPRKGFREMALALRELDRHSIELVVFGSNLAREASDLCLPINYLRNLHDDCSLRALYSAVDVMVVPSLQENLAQTAVEALACGTPVVAFAANGLLDIVDHKVNGYLAKPYSPQELGHGISWVLEHASSCGLRANARSKALECFEMKKVAEQYRQLYLETLGARQQHTAHGNGLRSIFFKKRLMP